MKFILKPILWNTGGYRYPTGVKANSGYPKWNGFGHEEWNNSPRLRFEQDGTEFCAFHTEGIGRLELVDQPMIVLMYASHDRVQDLVGIAGNATPLIAASKKLHRKRLAEVLSVDDLSEEAWRVPSVQRLFEGSRSSFVEAWNDGEGPDWIPNWFAPADHFLWLDPPVRLDPVHLTGKAKLLTMFSRYTEITGELAAGILNSIPIGQQNEAWRNIYASISAAEPDSLSVDLQGVLNREDIPATTKDALVKARLGQGQFRSRLEQRWGGQCAVSGCGIREVLRASHIKRWAESTDKERLDPANGLLLIANLDCLFDRGVISFTNDGRMLMSETLSQRDRQLLQVPANIRLPLSRNEMEYLAHHRVRYGFDLT